MLAIISLKLDTGEFTMNLMNKWLLAGVLSLAAMNMNGCDHCNSGEECTDAIHNYEEHAPEIDLRTLQASMFLQQLMAQDAVIGNHERMFNAGKDAKVVSFKQTDKTLDFVMECSQQLPAASMTYRSPNSTLDITIKGKKAHFYAEMK